MALAKIRLELARNPEFPSGSSDHGYEFIAPLDANGLFDAEEWRLQKARCTVTRFWAGEPDQTGHLVHTRGRSWAFRYEGDEADEGDEPIFAFDRHTFRAGDYVSITEHDGVQRTFVVAEVVGGGAH